MKKIIAMVIAASLIMGGCGNTDSASKNTENTAKKVEKIEKTEKTEGNKPISNEKIENAEKKKDVDKRYKTVLSEEGKIQVTSQPIAASYEYLAEKKNGIPKYNENNSESFQVDLRSRNLTKYNLKDRFDDLLYADFDSKTVWPESLPENFDPEKIMEIGKNPGLGVRELHKKGITGKGVGIAIIDATLLADHKEYKDKLKLYEEIHNYPGTIAQMHGPAVASIAVGDSVGVAPEADLYFIACVAGEVSENEFIRNTNWLSDSIDRIVEVNKLLPDKEKIRVISISMGFYKDSEDYKNIVGAIERAEKNGIHVIAIGLYPFLGLGRNPLENPDNINAYTKGAFWRKAAMDGLSGERLLIPMDSRTTAAPNGKNDYVHYYNGGLSWTVPYVAGLYALACQVNPNITPEEFWKTAMETGDKADIYGGKSVKYHGKIVNPEKMIDEIKKIK